MKNFTILLSGILLLPSVVHAKPQQADTIGTKIVHSYQITRTVTYIEQTIDSLMSLDDTLLIIYRLLFRFLFGNWVRNLR